jgi:hypothetical protein
MSSDGSVILFVVLLALFWFMPPAKQADEIVVYYGYCSDDKYNIYSCPKTEKIRTMKSEYLVSYHKQMVIWKGMLEISRKCTVYDKENWICTNDYGKTSMRDGEIWEENAGNTIDTEGKVSILPRYMQISALQYYLRYIRSFFS